VFIALLTGDGAVLLNNTDDFKYVVVTVTQVSMCLKFYLVIVSVLPYFPAHKTHRDFFVKNFRKKKK
jgi:hypothetical protein